MLVGLLVQKASLSYAVFKGRRKRLQPESKINTKYKYERKYKINNYISLNINFLRVKYVEKVLDGYM